MMVLLQKFKILAILANSGVTLPEVRQNGHSFGNVANFWHCSYLEAGRKVRFRNKRVSRKVLISEASRSVRCGDDIRSKANLL